MTKLVRASFLFNFECDEKFAVKHNILWNLETDLFKGGLYHEICRRNHKYVEFTKLVKKHYPDLCIFNYGVKNN